jgi:hypothetical protein
MSVPAAQDDGFAFAFPAAPQVGNGGLRGRRRRCKRYKRDDPNKLRHVDGEAADHGQVHDYGVAAMAGMGLDVCDGRVRARNDRWLVKLAVEAEARSLEYKRSS